MSLRLIKETHRILLKGVRGKEKDPGEFRRSQNWIGPVNSTIRDATFVPPSPQDVVKLMGDLEFFLHKNKGNDLVSIALIHYQFETIHPFLDGNGRLGRLLIPLYLSWKGLLAKPLLYISYFFKKHRQEYYDRLNGVRESGDYEQWVKFFLKGVRVTAESGIESTKEILKLQNDTKELLWKKQLSSPHLVKLVDMLFYNPYVTINEIAEKLDISYPAASNIASQLEKIGVLVEFTKKRRGKRFVFKQYLQLLEEGSKSLR